MASEVRIRVTHICTRWLFLRLLGLVYVIAFLSLASQVDGLIGSQGILPAANYIGDVSSTLSPWQQFVALPTLAWFNCSDGFLRFLCWGGALAGFGIMFSVAAAPLLAVAWLFYLSLVNIGQDFLSFQWDVLLLEVGFLAIFWCPWQVISFPWKGKLVIQAESKTFTLVLWLFRWLLFRLMFLSGSVKILSGDVAWRDLSALKFHYLTQPLPTPLAWLANQLPIWCQTTSVVGMFFIELAVPFMFFLPRPFRYAAAALTALLQGLILLTGNYTFFNLLTLALCLLLLDDALLMRVLPKSIKSALIAQTVDQSMPATAVASFKSTVSQTVVVAVAALVGAASVAQLLEFFDRRGWAEAVSAPLAAISSFHIVNTYGLFAVMTKSRLEISVEGSNDGAAWLPYTFKYKPGPLDRPPPVVAPFQPRLDWQMWFAALAPVSDSPWFVHFAYRLLQGSPPVVQLLSDDPFGGKPPKYIRAMLYDYRFSNLGELTHSGNWWTRQPAGTYLPPISLANFRVQQR